MKTPQVELPDQMVREVENVVRVALREFISQHRFEVMEQQQLKDIEWAVHEKAAPRA